MGGYTALAAQGAVCQGGGADYFCRNRCLKMLWADFAEGKGGEAVMSHFGVMLCQTLFFVGVEYHKSALPRQKIRLPRLMPNYSHYQVAQTEGVPQDRLP